MLLRVTLIYCPSRLRSEKSFKQIAEIGKNEEAQTADN